MHCTSINNTNALISGDNKGVASQLLEAWADGGAWEPSTNPVLSARSPGRDGTLPGFVAAFGQANVGDTSPNVLGAFCADTGALSSWLLALAGTHGLLKRPLAGGSWPPGIAHIVQHRFSCHSC